MDDLRIFRFLCHSNENNKRRRTKVEHLSVVESKCIKKHTPADLSGGLRYSLALKEMMLVEAKTK
jgi:ABC-type sulfate/molybdate transport systems ATPase subunit